MDLLLIIIPAVLILISQAYINSTYSRYNRISIKSKITGYEAARRILDMNNLNDVKIRKVSGKLTDNFNPKTNTISLSSDIYDGCSISSVAVAAHECGHVIQHKEKYFFIVLRGFLVPVVNISSNFGYIVMIIGILLGALDLALLGLIFMCAALVFQLITLPTEFNASNRAKETLLKLNIIDNSELSGVKTMLRSAALTYVASFFATLAQLLRLFLQINNNRRD